MAGLRRSPSELLKRGYSEEEIDNIYELGRLFLEGGELKKAETIFNGLVEIVPEYSPAWLGLAYIYLNNKAFEASLSATENAMRIDPTSPVALVYAVGLTITLGDANQAGTHLGDLTDRIRDGLIDDPNIIKLQRILIARYQSDRASHLA